MRRVEGFFRRTRPISDARPPARPRAARASCARCGEAVTSDQSIDRGRGIEHLVCEPAIVSDLDRRLEAGRALHRALSTLGAIAPLRAAVEDATRGLPDVVDPATVIDVLRRLRAAVEVTRLERPEQRRLSLSLLDALAHKLRGPEEHG